MELDKTDDERDGAVSTEREESIVETAGETTAAATGSAEIGAATNETGDAGNVRPVGEGTKVEVAGDTD